MGSVNTLHVPTHSAMLCVKHVGEHDIGQMISDWPSIVHQLSNSREADLADPDPLAHSLCNSDGLLKYPVFIFLFLHIGYWNSTCTENRVSLGGSLWRANLQHILAVHWQQQLVLCLSQIHAQKMHVPLPRHDCPCHPDPRIQTQCKIHSHDSRCLGDWAYTNTALRQERDRTQKEGCARQARLPCGKDLWQLACKPWHTHTHLS